MEHASRFLQEDLSVWQISAKFVHWLLINKNKRKKFLAIKNKDLVLHHPSYLADLATCDFFLFIRIKSQLLGHDFWDGPEIWDKSMPIPHMSSWSQLYDYLQGWQRHWTHCMNSEGDYFEGDSNDQ